MAFVVGRTNSFDGIRRDAFLTADEVSGEQNRDLEPGGSTSVGSASNRGRWIARWYQMAKTSRRNWLTLSARSTAVNVGLARRRTPAKLARMCACSAYR